MNGAWFPPNMMLRVKAKKPNLGSILQSFESLLGMFSHKLQVDFNASLTEKKPLAGYHKTD